MIPFQFTMDKKLFKLLAGIKSLIAKLARKVSPLRLKAIVNEKSIHSE